MTQAGVTLLFGSAASGRVPNLGASGAIAAVLGAYFILYPNQQRLPRARAVGRELVHLDDRGPIGLRESGRVRVRKDWHARVTQSDAISQGGDRVVHP
jgi:hypothetical protein